MRQLRFSESCPVSAKLFVCLLAVSSIVFIADELSAQAPATSTYAYVGSYSGQNRDASGGGYITGFAIASDGSAQPLSGSPFNGASYSLASASNYLFASDGRYIVTYTRAADGSLQQTSTVDGLAHNQSAGDMEVFSLNPDRSGQTLYDSVVCSSCNNYFDQWVIGSAGQLTYLGDPSTFATLSAAWGWKPLTFALNDRFAYTATTCHYDGAVEGVARHSNGTLTSFHPQAAPPPPLQAGGQVGCSDDVAASTAGYVAALWDGQYCCGYNGTLLGAYTINSDGTLALVYGSAAMPSVGESSMAFDPTGAYLALAGWLGDPSQNVGAIQIFKLQTDGRLVAVGGAQLPPGAPAFQYVQWDNAHHLYAVTTDCYGTCSNPNSYGLYVFNFNGQSLTQAPGSPHAINNTTSLAVVPGS